MKSYAKVLIFALWVLAAASSANAATVYVDQQMVWDTSQMGVYTDIGYGPWARPAAQTFTAGLSGTLAQIDLMLTTVNRFASDQGYGPISVGIHALDANGVPGSQLASVTLASSAIQYAPNTGAWVSVDFLSANYRVQAGEKYGIVLVITDKGPMYDGPYSEQIRWFGQASSPYSGGNLFFTSYDHLSNAG